MNYISMAAMLLTTPALAATWILTEVDNSPYTGAENAVYAPDVDTVYIAYKQFLEPPSGQYTPAALKVAKSVDGGTTWDLSVIDMDAPQYDRILERSVSIGGFNDMVYIAYFLERSGLFESQQLRVAKSMDAGLTWTVFTAVSAFGGAENAIKVINEETAYISFHMNGLSAGMYVVHTLDGGNTWSTTPIELGVGNGRSTSIDAADSQTIFCSYQYLLGPDHADLNFAASTDALQTVRLSIVEHVPDIWVGYGSAISVVDTNTIYISYGQLNPGAKVKLAASFDGGLAWTLSFIDPELGGAKTAIKAFTSGTIYSAYQAYPRPWATLARSDDWGSTWTRISVPESEAVTFFVSLAAPREDVAYISYATEDRRLKLATFTQTAR